MSKDLENWVVEFARAWQEMDPDAAVALFAEDARFFTSPFDEPHRGHEEIRRYWQGAVDSQERVDVQFGKALADGDRVAAEWWATLVLNGEEVTLPGSLHAYFNDDGRCREIHEYWHLEQGRRGQSADWTAS